MGEPLVLVHYGRLKKLGSGIRLAVVTRQIVLTSKEGWK